MLVMVDFGVERILACSCDMVYALRAAWFEMIYSYDEHRERAVERFREELQKPTEEALRAHKQSCRDYGYKWTYLTIKEVKELTAEEYEHYRKEEKLREANW